MIIRLSIVICLVMVVSATLTGQRITVSEEILLKDDNGYTILGEFDGRILLFRDRNTKYEVHAYDEHLRLRWERELTFERRSCDILAVVPDVSGFHVVYGYAFRGDYVIMHRQYTPELSLIDTVIVHTDTRRFFAPRYRAVISEDRSKVLLTQAEKETRMIVIAYDLHTQKTLINRELQFSSGSIRRDLRDMVITNSGDALIVLNQDRLSDRNRAFDILYIDAQAETVQTIPFELKDLVANDLHVSYDNVNRRLLLIGLFHERAVARSKGLFVAFIEPGTSLPKLRTVLFREELLHEVHGKQVSLNRGLSNFAIRDVAPRYDGGMLVIAELVKEYSRRPNMPRRDLNYVRGGWVDYYYEDLIVFSLHPDGSEHWNTVLHKKQYSQDDEAMYSSFFLFKTPEMLRLLFNDEIRQENMVSEYVIRGNGYFRRQSVFSTDYQRLRLRLQDGVQISYNECIIPSERSSRLNLVKITF